MAKKSKSQKNKSSQYLPKKQSYSSDSESKENDSDLNHIETSSDIESEYELGNKQNTYECISNSFSEIEYIDYNIIKNIKYKILNNEPHVKIKCFYNGSKWICPNPLNEKSCSYIENWYNSTHFIKMREIVMAMDVFNLSMNKMITTKNEPIILSEL